MRHYDFLTVDVFTGTRFGGNQLAVFPDARGLSDIEMQAFATEMNYSETSFVLPPVNPANTAQVRIFNRTAEMPFAGHPNVGTGFVLASLGAAQGDVLHFEEISGLVEVRIARDGSGAATGAEIDAPQPLRIIGALPMEAVARCVGVPLMSVRSIAHPPLRASVGVEFVLIEVEADALAQATPDLAAFRAAAAAHLPEHDRLSVLLYARDGERIRSRMFAPLAGTWEDPATGSANATLAALLLSQSEAASNSFEVSQGVEMGRPSTLHVRAWRGSDGVHASVGGGCVPVLRGEAELQ
jgi:trans-2,3-dihydro-3-hydroxyanthranilate isomerase